MKEQFLQVLNRTVPEIFDGMDETLALFHKDTYKSGFEAFLEKYGELFSLVEKLTAEDVTEQAFLQQVGENFASCVESRCNELGSKSKRDKYMINVNLFMVSFVLPGFLEMASKSVGKPLTQAVCETWAEHFKGAHIQAATSQDIDGGFKRKLCYVTTATCQALGLSPECEEVSLLKEYRDTVLLHTTDGKELVKQYYNIAPTIVKRIDRLADAKAVYKSLYEQYISKCITYIRRKEYDQCKQIYCDMVESLKERFIITNR